MSRKSFQELGRARRYERLRELRREQNPNEEHEDAARGPFIHERPISPHAMVMDQPLDWHGNAESDEGASEYNEDNADNLRNMESSEEEQNGEDEEEEENHEDSQEENDEDDQEEDEEDEEVADANEREAQEGEEEQGAEQDHQRRARNNHNADLQDAEPLYVGAPITLVQSMLLILTLAVHHNIDMSCLADIITVINLHCLQQGLKKNSIYKFRNFFSLGATTMIKHYYCTTCFEDLQSVDDVCPSCPRSKNSYFVQLSIVEQLREMFKRDGFYDSLQLRFQRQVNPHEGISDIYDGTIYKQWTNNGFLSNPHNISFSWYTDGIPVFESSKVSMWPLYLTINELPFADRKKRENTLLLGLWFGDKKPNPNLFLYKFRPEIERIAQGVQVFIPQENIEITVRGVILAGTADIIAKSDFLNFTQFNGNYGCPTCFTKGENVRIEPRGSVHVYRYEGEPVVRSLNECIDCADRARPDNPVMGVKGHAALSRLMPDYVEGMGIDRMHGVEGGVVKKILKLLFDVKYRLFPFSLYGFIEIINSRLQSIKPPKFVHRMPRNIEDLVHWKASELKMWFFYYSVPVLQGVLRQDYFEHYLLLVIAIALLSSEKIDQSMIDVAHDFLHKFVKGFEILYGLQFCSINVHQLLHLPACVERLGPLWTFTCFEYENINGQLLKLIHGTRHIDSQVSKSHDRLIKMIKLIDQQPIGAIRDFCLRRKRQVKIIERIRERCYSVGSYKLRQQEQLPNDIVNAMHSAQIPENASIRQYLRLLKDGKLYVSSMYTRDIQTQSCVIQYFIAGQVELGSVSRFIKTTNCNCIERICQCDGNHFAIVQKFRSGSVFVAHGDHFVHNSSAFLQECYETDMILVIPILDIVTVCVRMKIDDRIYIGIPVNQQELE